MQGVEAAGGLSVYRRPARMSDWTWIIVLAVKPMPTP